MDMVMSTFTPTVENIFLANMPRNVGNKIYSKKPTSKVKKNFKFRKSAKNEENRENLHQSIENDIKIKKKRLKLNKHKKKNLTYDSDDELNEIDKNFDISETPVDKQVSNLISQVESDDDDEFDLVKGSLSLSDDPLLLRESNSSFGFTDFESEEPSHYTILAEKVLEKLNEASREASTKASTANKVDFVYTKIAEFMKSYKSGKLPKAMKILPRLDNWEYLLLLTKPNEWSNNAVSEVVKTFIGVFSEAQAIKFFTLVLLPVVRLDILRNKSLNCHLYIALKKAVYKPGAWIKGILLPLCNEGCTYKEASIIGSVIKRVSIPSTYAAAALVCICKYHRWHGSTSYFLTVLFAKKFQIPRQALDSCVSYFSSFSDRKDQMPVIWHQSLLALVVGHSNSLTGDHIGRLKSLCKHQIHSSITPQILSHLHKGTDIDMD